MKLFEKVYFAFYIERAFKHHLTTHNQRMSQQVEDEGNNLKRKLSTDSDVPNGCPLNNAGNETETNTDEHFEADNEIDHLRQFDVLDEVQGDDSGSENGDNELKGNTILLTPGK